MRQPYIHTRKYVYDNDTARMRTINATMLAEIVIKNILKNEIYRS